MNHAADHAGIADTKAPPLLDQLRARLRLKHYSLRTEQAYAGWIRRFIIVAVRMEDAPGSTRKAGAASRLQ